MDRYVCTICGYVYDPEQGDPDSGVAAGTKWEDVPDDWECPVCGASKDDFEKEQQYPSEALNITGFLMPFSGKDAGTPGQKGHQFLRGYRICDLAGVECCLPINHVYFQTSTQKK